MRRLQNAGSDGKNPELMGEAGNRGSEGTRVVSHAVEGLRKLSALFPVHEIKIPPSVTHAEFVRYAAAGHAPFSTNIYQLDKFFFPIFFVDFC